MTRREQLVWSELGWGETPSDSSCRRLRLQSRAICLRRSSYAPGAYHCVHMMVAHVCGLSLRNRAVPAGTQVP